MPSFLRGGRLVCGLAGFRDHCALWFWHGKTVVGAKPAEGMGEFGKLRTLADLPSVAKLTGYVRKAVALAEAPSAPRARAKATAKAAPRPKAARTTKGHPTAQAKTAAGSRRRPHDAR
jgi:hypothetical protein